MPKTNYLIGKAERLAYRVPAPRRKITKKAIYTWADIQARLSPQIQAVANGQALLDKAVCPSDFAVSRVTMHPSYIAKSFYPERLFRDMNVIAVGSQSTPVCPDRWTRMGAPEVMPAPRYLVAGKRQSITEFANRFASISEASTVGKDLFRIWSFDMACGDEKIRTDPPAFEACYEVGLNLLPNLNSDFIKAAFIAYAQSLGFETREDIAIDADNLWFLPVEGDASQLVRLGEFSFVRVIRPISKMRAISGAQRASNSSALVQLPDAEPFNADVRVGVLDGGLPAIHVASRWVRSVIHSDPDADHATGGANHGLGVSSALLFGSLSPGQLAMQPFAFVDHIRVLDSMSENDDPYDLYRILANIEDVLVSRQYQFLNLSLGPDLPIDDNEIHPWTAVLDSHLSDGETLLTVAIGNNGERDVEMALNRIQVPADSVNALAVGAASHVGEGWARAPYSAVGPGRSPGVTKPDILAFGGSSQQSFHVLDADNPGCLEPVQGTSFAAPVALRSAIGIRAVLGDSVTTIAIKALLIHTSETNEQHKYDVGWGKVPEDLSKIIESADGEARIVYQGELTPGKHLRLPVPLPEGGLEGMVEIKATCCFACPLDSTDSSMYTRAGLTIQWLPKKDDKSETFFGQTKFAAEHDLRSDAGKWETVLHAGLRKYGSSLNSPAFTIHCMAREGGAPVSDGAAEQIKYAFVVTVKANKHPNLFTEIMNLYSEILTEIEPQVSIPVRT